MVNLLKAKSEFRKLGVVLEADKTKVGAGGNWKFASEDNFIKTIQKPLTECGLEIFATMSYIESLGIDVIKMTLYHVDSGEYIESSISMPTVEPKKDRNGNLMYLDAEIERGKQFGYWSRILGIRILGISDIDPEDMQNRQEDISQDHPIASQAQLQELTTLMTETDSDLIKMLGFVKVDKFESITVPMYEKLKKALISKKSKIQK